MMLSELIWRTVTRGGKSSESRAAGVMGQEQRERPSAGDGRVVGNLERDRRE